MSFTQQQMMMWHEFCAAFSQGRVALVEVEDQNKQRIGMICMVQQHKPASGLLLPSGVNGHQLKPTESDLIPFARVLDEVELNAIFGGGSVVDLQAEQNDAVIEDMFSEDNPLQEG